MLHGYTRMLQVYISNVLSIYVLYVAMAIHVCDMFVLNVSIVLNVCCKCFIMMLHMLQWLYIYVATVCFKCFTCFRCMLQQVLHIASVFISRHKHFRCMFHMFHPNVAFVLSECYKVDLVLQM